MSQVCTGDPTVSPTRGRTRPSVPTTVVGKELDLFQGVELLFRAAGHTEGGGTEPPIPDFQVAGIHEEHVSRRQRRQERAAAEQFFSLGFIVGLKKYPHAIRCGHN